MFVVPAPKARRPDTDVSSSSSDVPPDAAAAAAPEEDERTRALRLMEADTAPAEGSGLTIAGVRRLIKSLDRKVRRLSHKGPHPPLSHRLDVFHKTGRIACS